LDLETAFYVLGVEASCPQADAQRAFRARARLIHPDTTGDGARAEATRAMAELNRAWTIVRHSYREAAANPTEPTTSTSPTEPSPEPKPHPSRPPTSRLPVSGECDHCGWSPARVINLRRVIGLGLVWLSYRDSPSLCARCATAMFAETQARSLTQGWWGVIAPIPTLISLRRNRNELLLHRSRVGPPQTRAVDVVTPVQWPAAVRSHWRPVPIAATIVALVLLGALVVGTFHRSFISPSSSRVSSRLGQCVTDAGDPVDCVDPAAAWTLVRIGPAEKDCLGASLPRTFHDRDSGLTYCAQPLAP
jgi:hypothetical protein